MRAMIVSVLSVPALMGCAQVPAESGFADVKQEVAARLGQTVHWQQGTQQDEAVRDAVSAMLEKELDVDAAVQIALLNNRSLQATYETLGVAQAALVQAGLLRNPIFDAFARFPLSGGSTELGLTIVQDFLDVFYVSLRKRVAASEFEAVKLRVAAMVMDLAARTRAALYRLQADEQLLEMRRQIVLATSASYEAMRRLREAGNVRRLDVDNERALFERARLDLAVAQAAVIESREWLNRLMGLWGADTQWTIAHRLPEIPDEPMNLDHFESRAIAASLDLAIVRQDIVSLGEQLGLVKTTALVPVLNVGPDSERDEGQWEVGPTVSLLIPLFDQGQARIAAARSELRQRRQEYVALAVEIRSVVRAARQRLVTAGRVVERYENVMLDLQNRIVDETQAQYNAMQVGVFQLLLAKQLQIETGQRYIAALRDYWLARTELEQILQGRLTDLAGGVLARNAIFPAVNALTTASGHQGGD